MSRQYYARTSNYRAGIQSSYDAGLSYFPDVGSGLIPTPLGNIATDLAAGAGTAVGGPAGGAAAGLAASVVQRWFGGAAVDQQRQARVNYFAQLAVNGNVAAMQMILSAPDNVSGNEKSMWETAASLIQQANPDVVAEAHAAGPLWFVNSGDTATNYPVMRNAAAAWAAQHPFTAVSNAVGTAIGNIFTPTPPANGVPSAVPYYGVGGGSVPVVNTVARTSPISPVVLYGALAVGAYFLLSSRKRS